MKLYEYSAKELFRREGIPTPGGGVAETPEEAAGIAEKLGCDVAGEIPGAHGWTWKGRGEYFSHHHQILLKSPGSSFHQRLKGKPLNGCSLRRRYQ